MTAVRELLLSLFLNSKESSKPFLIMRTLDGEKHVEIVFGYAERKWDISRPLSVIDLQKALQSGFSYENRLTERLDNLEALVQKITENLATVTEQINELVLQRMERTAADE
jgi:hypothetical protein